MAKSFFIGLRAPMKMRINYLANIGTDLTKMFPLENKTDFRLPSVNNMAGGVGSAAKLLFGAGVKGFSLYAGNGGVDFLSLRCVLTQGAKV